MKIIRSFAALLAVLMVVSCVLLAGCQAYVQTQYEVPNYQGQLKDGQTKSDFNQELFYRNDKKAGCPDPFVLDNTSRDGYYYLYGTEGSLYCYRSKDLMDWERVGNALDNMDYASPGVMSEIRLATWKDIWAPEVVYDPDEQLYYMFFSATPKADEEVNSGNGSYLMMVAVSQYPEQIFVAVLVHIGVRVNASYITAIH